MPQGHCWRWQQQLFPGLTSLPWSSQPETPALLTHNQLICAFNHPWGIGFFLFLVFCFHAKGLLCPPALALLGGWPASGACSQKSSQWSFPLSSLGCNSRFLLRVCGSLYRRANPWTLALPFPSLIPRCWHDPWLGSNLGHRCSKSRGGTPGGKCLLLFLWTQLDATRSLCWCPGSGQRGIWGGMQPLGCIPQCSLAFLHSPGTRVSPQNSARTPLMTLQLLSSLAVLSSLCLTI